MYFCYLLTLLYFVTVSSADQNVVTFQQKGPSSSSNHADHIKSWALSSVLTNLFDMKSSFNPGQDEIQTLLNELGLGSTARVKLEKFSWHNCGSPKTDLLNISSLVISPDPVVLPGTIHFGFGAVLKGNIKSPIQGKLKLDKKIEGLWVEIPCMDMVGSCTYDDLCVLLSMVPQCPSVLTDQGISCTCPFKAGKYSVPKTAIKIPVLSFMPPAGDYYAKVELTRSGKAVGCYELYLSFSNSK